MSKDPSLEIRTPENNPGIFLGEPGIIREANRMDKTAYLQFLRSKLPVAERAGFEPPSPCHVSLKPHQRDICEWACRGGRGHVSVLSGEQRIHCAVP